MINFSLNIQVPEFNKEAYDKAVEKALLEQIKIAGSKFLEAALKAIPQPNPPAGGISSDRATGFVAASFLNLKVALGNKATNVGKGLSRPSVVPKKKVKGTAGRRLTTKTTTRGGKQITVRVINEYYYPPGGGRVSKTPENAKQYATPSEQVFLKTELGYIFQYSVDIAYFTLQENKNIGRSKYAPWRAFVAGNEAFTKYLNSPEIVNKIFPDINEFLITKTYRIG
jgi:hypothetical protein